MRTVAAIKAEIEKVENRKFFLAMKDHWDADDFDYDFEMDKEIRALKAELKAAQEAEA